MDILVESMVSVLLLLTILYCVRLNKQLRLLKADEQTLRATIAELITATEIAERAIARPESDHARRRAEPGRRGCSGRRRSPPTSNASSPPARNCWRGSPALPARRGRPAIGRPPCPTPMSVAAAAQAFAERTRVAATRTIGRSCRMIRFARDFRLIPVVLLATICLFALKVSGLVFDGGYTLAERLQGLDKNGMHVTTAENVPDYPKIVFADNESPPPVSAAPRQTALGAGDAQLRRRQRRHHRFGRRRRESRTVRRSRPAPSRQIRPSCEVGDI